MSGYEYMNRELYTMAATFYLSTSGQIRLVILKYYNKTSIWIKNMFPVHGQNVRISWSLTKIKIPLAGDAGIYSAMNPNYYIAET